MAIAGKRLVILHSRSTPRGARHHMVMEIADDLAAMGVQVVHLHDTDTFVPASGIFVHVDLSVVSPEVTAFAQRYPVQINAQACDIRKRGFADGLLGPGSPYDGPVIVKSDLNYGGVPELNDLPLFDRASRRLRKLKGGAGHGVISAKADYRIFSSLAGVPQKYWTDENVVQKLVLEKEGVKNLLREYIFFGDLHFENIERSTGEIITEDEHVSCRPFTPHPRLLDVRRRLKLDYGKIDYVMAGGEPFIFDANKTLGMGASSGSDGLDPEVRAMLHMFAARTCRLLETGSAEIRAPDAT